MLRVAHRGGGAGHNNVAGGGLQPQQQPQNKEVRNEASQLPQSIVSGLADASGPLRVAVQNFVHTSSVFLVQHSMANNSDEDQRVQGIVGEVLKGLSNVFLYHRKFVLLTDGFYVQHVRGFLARMNEIEWQEFSQGLDGWERIKEFCEGFAALGRDVIDLNQDVQSKLKHVEFQAQIAVGQLRQVKDEVASQAGLYFRASVSVLLLALILCVYASIFLGFFGVFLTSLLLLIAPRLYYKYHKLEIVSRRSQSLSDQLVATIEQITTPHKQHLSHVQLFLQYLLRLMDEHYKNVNNAFFLNDGSQIDKLQQHKMFTLMTNDFRAGEEACDMFVDVTRRAHHDLSVVPAEDMDETWMRGEVQRMLSSFKEVTREAMSEVVEANESNSNNNGNRQAGASNGSNGGQQQQSQQRQQNGDVPVQNSSVGANAELLGQADYLNIPD